MMRLATAFIAAMLALTVPAQAYDIWQTLQLHGADRLPFVGCTHLADAREAQRFQMIYGHDRAQAFALQIDDFVGGRACVIFQDPGEKFRLMDKRQQGSGYHCIESTRPSFNVGWPKDAGPPPPPKPLPCFWVFLLVPGSL